jgi:hypothetical protein
VCTALDQCHDAGTCNTGTGVCSNPDKANGSACNDTDACTQTDTCQTGACVGGNPVVCSASDQCHVAGTCDPGTGLCTNPAADDGTVCTDGNACTQSDLCQSGVCVGTPVVCGINDQCHVAGTCDPGTGLCTNPAADDGTACNDTNACTQTDTCQSGACVGANPVVCSASDQCHVAGTCDPGTGFCSNPVAPNGAACNDGNSCTAGDVCSSGTCNGTPVPPPAVINNSVRVDKAPTNATISWNDPPGGYDVYRGAKAAAAAWSYNQTCLGNGLSGSSLADTNMPLPGQLFFYLVSRADACGESSLGTDSAGAQRPNNSSCSAP